MAPQPPQTLSVKRKRNEAPVDSLVIEHDGKRLKSETYAWRLLEKPDAQIHPPLLSPTTQESRRFFIDASAQLRDGRKHVLVENKATMGDQSAVGVDVTNGQADKAAAADSQHTSVEIAPLRKRPGAGTALQAKKDVATEEKAHATEVSAKDMRKFEEFAKSVEKEEVAPKPSSSPLKYKPKAPALRYKDRHPEKAAVLAAQDPDAMDLDSDEYVYDTYIREVIMPDAEGKIPQPGGTVGFIVINKDDDDWFGEDESDKEFDTDDEDENAEDYYANDYPEDELSSDDEYDRDLYQPKYRHGSDDEEFDLNNDGDEIRSDEDDDDRRFRMTAHQPRPGYWGRYGE